jgi:hypothetical protein
MTFPFDGVEAQLTSSANLGEKTFPLPSRFSGWGPVDELRKDRLTKE